MTMNQDQARRLAEEVELPTAHTYTFEGRSRTPTMLYSEAQVREAIAAPVGIKKENQ